jgi:hypothetical protein
LLVGKLRVSVQRHGSATGSSVRWQGLGQLAASDPESNDPNVTVQPQHPTSLHRPTAAARSSLSLTSGAVSVAESCSLSLSAVSCPYRWFLTLSPIHSRIKNS